MGRRLGLCIGKGTFLCHNVSMFADRSPTSVDPEQAGEQPSSARIVLLRVLGDLAYPTDAPVPTSALLTVLDDVGFGAHAVRQAISRCARKGLLASEKDGRTTRWSLTTAGRDLMRDGNARARQLGVEPDPWAGRWLVLAISIPHERRVIRQKLYRTLAWAGCGTPVPGIWIGAHPERREQISAALTPFELARTAVSFIGEASGIGLSDSELVAQAWDLDSVSSHYRDAIEQFATASEPASGPDAVRLLLQVDEILQDMVSQDPWLPAELCPDWTGRQDAARLLAYRDALLVPARAYWANLLEP